MLNTRRKFTMIELILVIAIIMILVSMLLPALNSTREKAKSIKCAGNMKQLGYYHATYLNDYNDYVIKHLYSGYPAGKNVWYQMMQELYYIGPVLWNSGGSLGKGGKSVWFCPSEIKTKVIACNYIQNYLMLNIFGYPANTKIQTFKRPSSTVWIADMSIPNGLTESDNLYVLTTDWDKVPGMTKLGFNHNLSGNWLFLDGHVSSRRYTENREKEIYGK